MNAPQRFANWLQEHRHEDKKTGRVYQYHSRSDAHSVVLCEMILEDLILGCPAIRAHALDGKIGYGINLSFQWPSSQKKKAIDLAIGIPVAPLPKRENGIEKLDSMSRVLISCEAKAVMTEHSKSQPRIFDELSSSHEIVHRGDDLAVAAGVTVVNIADTFISPLRQKNGNTVVTSHKQPDVAGRMVSHLRGLKVRGAMGESGFDAYSTIVIDCTNRFGQPVALRDSQPSPQAGDPDHYDTFLRRICEAYTARFNSLP